MPLDLKTIHQRIKDNIDVLCNFSAKREEGKERAEYMSLLKKDLCTYYSYNHFLIEKLIDIFPLSEVRNKVFFSPTVLLFFFSKLDFFVLRQGFYFLVLQLVDFLEANEIQRPVTIRTNTLKTRRRDLAQVTTRSPVMVLKTEKSDGLYKGYTKLNVVIIFDNVSDEASDK